MRLARLIPAIALVFFSSPVWSQDWFEYVNREDRFSANLPVQPRMEAFTYISEYGSKLKAHRYVAELNGSSYTITVVDMSTTDLTPDNEKVRNLGRYGNELRGSIAFAATNLRQTGKVTLDAYAELQVIPGHQLQITLPDGRRSFSVIYLHQKRLYISEAIVPKDAPPPSAFQASLAILDADGNAPRYEDNNYSFPDGRPPARQGAGAPPAAAGR